MKKFKTVAEAGEALRIAAEAEQKEVAEKDALQKQITAGEVTPSGKPIVKFGDFPKTSSRN